MRTSRAGTSSRRAVRRTARKATVVKPLVKVVRPAPPAPQQVMYRMCKPGWAVTVEKTPTALGTRFVCPFCPLSHRVPGPVRGFRKVRRAQWVKLRRVAE
jgi:hypothetical protein